MTTHATATLIIPDSRAPSPFMTANATLARLSQPAKSPPNLNNPLYNILTLTYHPPL
ncbi:MAG: hypothetical protein Q4C05_05475 [Akkermansia sp.]|nr:hypothetical protein [Akkermansia sp.]